MVRPSWGIEMDARWLTPPMSYYDFVDRERTMSLHIAYDLRTDTYSARWITMVNGKRQTFFKSFHASDLPPDMTGIVAYATEFNDEARKFFQCLT